MIRMVRLTIGLMLAMVLVAGCMTQKKISYKPAPLTAEEREEIQMRILDGDFEAAYAATIAILQDEAWNLTEINKDSGVIQAETKRRRDKIGPSEDWQQGAKKKGSSRKKSGPSDEVLNQWTRWEKVTCHIEPWGAGKVRERITLVKHGSLPAVTYSYAVGSLGNRKVVNVNELAREDQAVEDDPLVYGKLFNRIKQAMAERQKLAQ